jgi:hypothetical protein
MKKTILNLLFLVTVAIANAQYVPTEDSNPKSKIAPNGISVSFVYQFGLGNYNSKE